MKRILVCLAAAITRLFAFQLYETFSNRIEISNPLNSFKRLAEGKRQSALGIDAYASGNLHLPTTYLKLYTMLIDFVGEEKIWTVWIAADLLIGCSLYCFAAEYCFLLYVREEKRKHRYVEDFFAVRVESLKKIPFYVLFVYLFSPYSVVSCCALTTSVIDNLLLALFLLALIKHQNAICVIIAAFSTTQSFYTYSLIAPIYLNVYNKNKSHHKAATYLLLYVTLLAILTNLNKNSLLNTYYFTWFVHDQQPNVGTFWYMFSEMFDQYRPVFLYSFQANAALLYILPLTFTLRHDPPFLAFTLLSLISIFKSYPALGDFCLFIGLYPCWWHLCTYTPQAFFGWMSVEFASVVTPVIWDLWVVYGTANANFYFGASVGFVGGFIFLLCDILYGLVEREYALQFGKSKVIDGRMAELTFVYNI